MKQTDIVISPAHHPKAQGASYLGFYEHPESLIWSHLVFRFLRKEGVLVRVLKAGRLSKKIERINKIKPRLAIEIHFNGSKNETVNGCETLYCPGSEKGLLAANIIHSSYSDNIRKDRGVKEGWYRMDVPGRVDYKGDVEGDETINAFLKKTTCPALILEPEFISQKTFIQKNRKIVCEDIGKGILEFLMVTET